jgi:hypothetical protein
MKRSLALAGAVGVVMAGVLGVVAFEARHRHPSAPARKQPGPTEPAPVRAATAGPVTRTVEAPPSNDIDALLAEGTPRAWALIASLYPASDERTKQRALQQVARMPELERAIAYVLATVGEDPTPPGEDRMVDEAARMLGSRVAKFEDFEYARQTMVMQKTDKRRWILARALVDHAKTLEDAAFAELKGALSAKLIDMHSDVRDGFVRAGLAEGVRALGGRDAALILERSGQVTDAELLAVAEEQAAMRPMTEGNAP